MNPIRVGAAWSRGWTAIRGRTRPLTRKAGVAGLCAIVVLVGAGVLPAAGAVADSSTVTPSAGPAPQVQLADQNGPLGSLSVNVPQSVYGSVYNPGGTVTLPAPPSYPAPPAGFVQQVEALVTAAVNTDMQMPNTDQAAVAQEGASTQALIAAMTPQQLGMLYWALNQQPGWQTFTGTFNSMAQQLAGDRAVLAGTGVGAATTGPSLSTGGAAHSSQQAVTVLSVPPGGFNPSSAPPDTCSPAVPGGEITIHSVDVAVTLLEKARNIVPQLLVLGAVVLGEGTEFTIPDPVWDVLEFIAAVGEIGLSALEFVQAVHDSCETDAHNELLKDLYDNLATTQQELLGTTTTILNDVEILQAIDNSRSQTILNALASLHTQINNQVSSVLDSQNALTQMVNNESISQQTVNQQNAQYQKLQLTVSIEQNLLQTSQLNIATYELPASVGGYLNSTPVGVQEVVTQTVAEMQAAGIAIDPDALQDLSNANASLDAGNYKLAYLQYKAAYQTLVAINSPMTQDTHGGG